MTGKPTAPLKVDPETDALISHGAHFLGLTKKELVAQAVRDYVEAQRTEIEKGVSEAAALLAGSHAAKVVLLSGLTKDEIEELGGVPS